MRTAKLRYSAQSLRFKKSVIDELLPNECFQIDTPEGSFLMSRAEFEVVFNNVAQNELNYVQGDAYSYKQGYIPAKALPFLINNRANSNVISMTRRKAQRATWPQWNAPEQALLLETLKKMIPFVKFLSPAVVEMIAKDNNDNATLFTDLLGSSNIKPENYLWQGSPCAFPGVRRFVGNGETKRTSVAAAHTQMRQALYLDDNQYPRHIWAFVFLGRPSPSQGPEDYALSHLIDHKAYNRDRFKQEIIVPEGANQTLHGLFSSAANVCYIHNSVYKATDFQSEFRKIIQHKAYDLFKDVCHILPPDFKNAPLIDEARAISNFNWSDPVGTTEFMSEFLKFRRAELTRLVAESVKAKLA